MKRHWLLPDTPHANYEAYCAHHGGATLTDATGELSSSDILDRIAASHLRGRGGAGFPTGTKWASIARHACPTRTVVCNAAEGEPGTFKDRYLLDKSPYATIEGMVLAARAVGATTLYFATKAAFESTIARVLGALEEMGAAGQLEGLEVHVVQGPDEYLFGEEKALLNVIEGEGPFPREAHYPPYEWGIDATLASPNPALVNNVETFAHAATIVRHGPEGFLALGTHDTPGTIIATVSGDVVRPGVYEVEAGTSLRALLEEHAGGAREGRELRAVFSGVASGVIPSARFDTPCDFGSMHMARTGLGSAGFVVIDDATSMPRALQSLARFLYVESCGQCPACKHGLQTAAHAIDGIFEPLPEDRTREDLLAEADEGAHHAPQGNRCYLPVQGATLVPSVLKLFAADFSGAIDDSEPFVVPKLVAYDEATHSFTYDKKQMSKRANWEYEG